MTMLIESSEGSRVSTFSFTLTLISTVVPRIGKFAFGVSPAPASDSFPVSVTSADTNVSAKSFAMIFPSSTTAMFS
ncbi:hypothetical protein D3C76_1075990 [compost metagenome]